MGLTILLFATPPLSACSWDFRNNLWGPAYLLLHNMSPYKLKVLFPNAIAVWFPPGIGAFLPLGLLDCLVAAKIWLILSVTALFGILWLCTENSRPTPGVFAACLLAIFLFPPLYTHLELGQFSIILTLLILFVVSRYSRPWSMFLALALGLTKPQLGVLIYPGLLFQQFRSYGVRGAYRHGFILLAVCLLLTCLLILIQRLKGWAARIMLFGGTLAVYGGQVALRWGNDVPDSLMWWIPPAMLLVFSLSTALDQRERKQVWLPIGTAEKRL